MEKILFRNYNFTAKSIGDAILYHLKGGDWCSFFQLMSECLLFPAYENLGEKGYKNELCSSILIALIMMRINACLEKTLPGKKRSNINFTHNNKIYILELKVKEYPYQEHKRKDEGLMQVYNVYTPEFFKENREVYIIGINFTTIKLIKNNRDNKLKDGDYVTYNNINNVYMKKSNASKKAMKHWSIQVASDREFKMANEDLYKEY